MEQLSIYEQLSFCTARIETEDSSGNTYSGTGFFFSLKVKDKEVPLLVTNKHVVRGMKKGRFLFTIADADGNPDYVNHFAFDVDGTFETMWKFHPHDDVDLCVLPIVPLLNAAIAKGKHLFYRTLGEELIPNDTDKSNLDAIEDIIMIGYPNGLWDQVNNMPIIRKGITATNVTLDYNGKKEFLIDAACFPGSSGSPVLICNVGGYKDKRGNLNWGKSRVFLLGILYAGPQMQVTGDFQVVTVPDSQQKAVSVSRIPNNLGFIIKSERLLDFKPMFESLV